MIHEKHMDWLAARKISLEIASLMGVHTKPAEGKNWLAVPYTENGVTVNHKYRLTSEKDHRMDPDAPLTLWNADALHMDHTGPVVITEGEWDALAAITAGWPRTVSVPNGAPQSWTENLEEANRYRFIRRNQPALDGIEKFIMATDNDEPGRILASELVRLLGPERCMSVKYPDGCKDLNDVLIVHGEREVMDALRNARPYPVKGLYEIDDFPNPPAMQAWEIGIEGMDYLYRVVPGTFTVISGYAGMGKSSLLMVMIAQLMRRGVTVCLASFETMVKPVLQRRMRAALNQCAEFSDGARNASPADRIIQERLKLIAHSPRDDDTDLDLGSVLNLAMVSVLRHGTRVLVIDPWNEIEHKRHDTETETEYIGRAIRELKRFAKLYDCAVWLVAHPRKPVGDGKLRPPSLYDIASSAHFANKADYGVVVHRDKTAGSLVDFRVTKVRMGLPGHVGTVTLDYDAKTSTYAKYRQPA